MRNQAGGTIGPLYHSAACEGNRAAHADGTLKTMSMKWFGVDYATPAAAFDLAKLAQEIP
jgi:hypothetical protein